MILLYISDEVLKNLPFGPLEKDVWENLSRSDLDASRQVAHTVAAERGVEFGAAARLAFAEKLALRGIGSVNSSHESAELTDSN